MDIHYSYTRTFCRLRCPLFIYIIGYNIFWSSLLKYNISFKSLHSWRLILRWHPLEESQLIFINAVHINSVFLIIKCVLLMNNTSLSCTGKSFIGQIIWFDTHLVQWSRLVIAYLLLRCYISNIIFIFSQVPS